MTVSPSSVLTAPGTAVDASEPRTVRVGRSRDNDVVLSDLLVSRHHAVLRADLDGGYEVVDLDSHNGTFVDGRRVARSRLSEGQLVRVGNTTMRLEVGRLVVCAPAPLPALDARGLTVRLPDGQVILDDATFRVGSGQLVAVVGPTGSGKSTLLKTITGFLPPTAGDVVVAGRDLYADLDDVRRGIGYVPQDDILHPQLTVRRALTFAAQLRFSPDVGADERRRRVDEVMGELGLTRRADVQVGRLSGGQRKRTSLALELLTAPDLLLLDEPTSGLDPGYERAVMVLLRQLADAGRGVAVVTHSLSNLRLCDAVLFLAQGGRTAFFGPPAHALHFFGRRDFVDVFTALDSEDETPRLPTWRQTTSKLHVQSPTVHGGARGPRRQAVPRRRQTSTLVRRQLAILGADRRNFAFLGLEVLVPALLILSLVPAHALDHARAPNRDARTLLGALAVSAAAIGAANALREIVKESSIYLRERAAGLSRGAYLAAKVTVFGSVTVVQAALLVAVDTARAHGPSVGTALDALPELMVGVGLAAVAAVALGLLISALVSTSEKAMALIAVVFIVEWLFSGAATDLSRKPLVRALSYTTSANWGLAAAASTIDLRSVEPCGPSGSSPPPGPPAEHRPPGDGSARQVSAPAPAPAPAPAAAPGAGGLPIPCDARWTHERSWWLADIGGLLLLTAAAIWGANRALARKEPVRR